MPILELSYVLVDDRLQPAGGSAAQQAAAPPPPAGTARPARYTRSLLRQTLQLMGQKPRQSDKAAQKAFLILQQRAALPPTEPLSLAARLAAAPGGHAGVTLSRAEFDRLVMDCLAAAAPPAEPVAAPVAGAALAAAPSLPERQPMEQQQAAEQHPQAQGRRVQQQEQKEQQLRLAERERTEQQGQLEQRTQNTAQPPAPPASMPLPVLGDFRIACALREQRTSVAILLCGTSGTGKSTLAALLAARLGISTVVSTDSLRHMMRSFCSEDEDPLLWASTYQAGPALQALQAASASGAAGGPAAVAAAAAAHRLLAQYCPGGAPGYGPAGLAADPRKAAVKGYKAQSARVLQHVDRLLAGCEARRQSVVVEGVHLSLSMVVRMMQRHPSVLPFLVHISNEAKHMERFAVRSKVMTLRPDGNRYVKYFRNIRAIQDYLGKSADKHSIPKVNNTNVDRSVATIHATVLGCLRRTAQGERVLSGPGLSCKPLLEEYLRCQSATWSSSDMLEILRRKSAAGEAPGAAPCTLEDTTSTATATAPVTTPRGPLSDAAAEEHFKPALAGRGSGSLPGRHAEDSMQQVQQAGQAGQAADGQQGEQEGEGDNSSFYGSDSNSSSQEGDGSTSCSCSERSSEGAEEGEEGSEGEGQESRSGGSGAPGGLSDSAARGHSPAHPAQHADNHSGLAPQRGAGQPPRRQRPRDRRRPWRRAGSSGGSTIGEIPSGPIPERQRRRSEVGSVLEPEPHSDTEDAEAGLASPPQVHA
ncbi:hypothetical protein ABPG75_006835 [Micractinium tetrahymenae]